MCQHTVSCTHLAHLEIESTAVRTYESDKSWSFDMLIGR